MAKKKEDRLSATDEMFDKLRKLYNAACAGAFVLYGNVMDFVTKDHQTLPMELTNMFSKNGKTKKTFIHYDKADGITFTNPSERDAFKTDFAKDLAEYEGQIPTNPELAFRLISKALRGDHLGAGLEGNHYGLMVHYAETIFPQAEAGTLQEQDRIMQVAILKLAKDKKVNAIASPIFLITSSLTSLHHSLREPSSRISAISIPYPDPQERLDFIEYTLKAYRDASTPMSFDEGFDKNAFARLTAGLSRANIIDVIMTAFLQKKPLGLALVKDRKNDIVRQEFGDVLQIMDPDFGFEVIGGYDYVKDFFRRDVIAPIKSGNKRRVPMGVLLVGPPGTGKTIFATTVAYESQVSCINLKAANLKSKWVGSTEERTAKAINVIKSLAPCIVFCDEADVIMNRDENAHEVSKSMFGSWLEFLSDTSHRGDIVFIGATNLPDRLDPAFLRPGRMDSILLIGAPTAEERPAIYKAVLDKHSIKNNIASDDLLGIEKNEEGHWANAESGNNSYVGADIESIVLKAFRTTEDSGREEVTVEDIRIALSKVQPGTKDIKAMEAVAVGYCTDEDLKPLAYRKKVSAGGSADASGLNLRGL